MKRLLLKTGLALFPRKYLVPLMQKIDDRAYEPLDYAKHRIMMARGVAKDSTEGEPELVNWVENVIHPGDVLYDIGANVGVYALIAAKYHKQQVKCYAFEPAVNTLPLLIQNIIANGCQDSVIPLGFALAAEPKLAAFNYTHMGSGRALHAFGDAVDYKGDTFQPVFRQFMLSVTLDDLVAKYGLPAPNYIKIDVDGIEPEILGGGRTVLSAKTMKGIFVEVSSRFDENVMTSLLKSCGLEIVTTIRHTNTANRIFARPS